MGPLTAALCASLFIQGLVVVLFLRFLSGDREQHAQALSALLVQAQEQADAQARERRELYQRIQAPEIAVQTAAIPERFEEPEAVELEGPNADQSYWDSRGVVWGTEAEGIDLDAEVTGAVGE
jgi:hypothetical protein